MADSTSSVLKRPHPEDHEANDAKRARSNNGSPRPTTPSATAPAGTKPDMSKVIAEARARAEALKARLAASKPGASAPRAAAVPQTGEDARQARMAALKAKVSAMTSKSAAQPQQKAPSFAPPAYTDDTSKARGGLNIGLHPDLMQDSQRDAQRNQGGPPPSGFLAGFKSRKTEAPAPAKAKLDISAPSIEELKENPYYDASLGHAMAKRRTARQLEFNTQGKYMAQAAALRRQAQLENMKKRIAEKARQAGMEEDLDMEKAFLVPEPPKIEWWDQGLVEGDSYDAISNPANLKIDTPDSIITIYVQHPVQLMAPQDKNMPDPKPLYLTKKETAKMRRQKRSAILKEEQAKIRLGLVPPPPPKVKKGNLMRVLGEEAVKDPTAVEARVNREIAERHQKHLDENEDRKLSKDERAEKLARQQADDESKGIHVRVYKIDSLANGKHRYQISINADQNKLTGVCILHPKLNLVIVEGGEHSIRNYDKLMQNRIHWTDMEAPRAVEEGNREVLAKWLEAIDPETNELKDLSLNQCVLVFGGENKNRAFRKWLGARVCETDQQAKDVLSRARMDNFWAMAKTFKKDV
jgi:U4/U6 small nuclear ribonucleoprotein PRP3